MLIPLAIGLVGADGRTCRCRLEEGLIGGARRDRASLSRPEFRFTGVKERPVLSLNRGFSAPIKLASNLTDNDLIFLDGA